MPKTLKLKLDIKASAGFNLSLLTRRSYVVSGSDATYQVIPEALTDYTNNIGLVITGLPIDATAILDSNPVGHEESTVLAIKTTGISAGKYIFNIDASSRLGKTYYVNLNGSDSNDGLSETSAWQTSNKVSITDFTCGDRILFEGGSIFDGTLYFNNLDIGTETDPILISSYGNGHAIINSSDKTGFLAYNTGCLELKKIDFTGNGTNPVGQRGIYFFTDLTGSTQRFKHIYVEKSNVSGYPSGIIISAKNTAPYGFDGIRITDCSSHNNLFTGIGVSGGIVGSDRTRAHKNLYIADCFVNDIFGAQSNTGNGITVADCMDGTVEYCESFKNGYNNYGTTGGPEGVMIYRSDDIIVQHCISHDNFTGPSNYDGGGFDLDGGTNRCILQYNYAYNNEGHGIFLGNFTGATQKNNNIVRYNILENNGLRNNYGGIGFWGQSGNVDSGCRLYNNVVYTSTSTSGSPRCVSLEIGAAGTIHDFALYNNIFIANNGYDLVNISTQTSDFTFQNNLYWSPDSDFDYIWGGTTYTSLAAWRTATGQETSGIQANPNLVNAGSGEKNLTPRTMKTLLEAYKLQNDSTCINTGLDLFTLFGMNVGRTDFYGNILPPQDGTFCIGAQEY